MIIADKIAIMAEFGKGTLVVGAAKNDDYWYICISEGKFAANIGEHVEKDHIKETSNEIILTFTNENQMLKVMAAFTNKTFEAVLDKWMAAREAKIWVVVAMEDIKNEETSS